tara:strand:- start:3106 stop:3378 length:273 start_codon:yes stop_codon:yes gene_type:complete
MDLIELIFKLVKKFVPISMEEYQRLYNEADDWKSKLNPKSKNKVEQIYCKYMNLWYVRLTIAIAYIPAVKSIMDMQRPQELEQEEEASFF